MTSDRTPLETIDALLRRIDVIACLWEESKDKRTLEEEIDVSRSTVDRAVRELEATDVLEYSAGDYTFTPTGELATTGFFELIETLEVIEELSKFLDWIPASEFDIDVRLLTNAEITYAESADPAAPIDRHTEILETAEQIKALSPILGPKAIEVVRDRLVEGSAQAEFILGKEASEVFQSDPKYIDLKEDAFATGRFKCFSSEDPVPYYLGLVDEDQAQIGAISPDGTPRALLETESPEVRSWVQQKYNRYKQSSRALPG